VDDCDYDIRIMMMTMTDSVTTMMGIFNYDEHGECK